jgi:ATP-binding cassette subfamily F protein 3
MAGAGELAGMEKELRSLEAEMASPDATKAEAALDAYGEISTRFEAAGGYQLEAEAQRVLAGLGFKATDANRSVSELSGGWRMRATLAQLLLSKPEVLVLDEPTNHLDVDSVTWLEEQLAAWPGSILFVSHDRDFIDAVAERVIEVVGGGATEYVGGFAEFIVQREERLANLQAQAASQAKSVAATEKFIDRFRYKATKARQVQSRLKTLEKLDRIELPDHRQLVAKFGFPKPQRSAPCRGRARRHLGGLRRRCTDPDRREPGGRTGRKVGAGGAQWCRQVHTGEALAGTAPGLGGPCPAGGQRRRGVLRPAAGGRARS